jgi:hypothetical protein
MLQQNVSQLAQQDNVESPDRDIQAYIQGEMGQLVVGNYNIQIGSIHGSVVNILSTEQQPHLQPRATPVFLLPRPFPQLLGRQAEVSIAIASFQSTQSVEFYSEPGLGKSVLLRHLAYHPQATSPFIHGAVNLTANQPVADLLQSLFEAFYDCDISYKPTDTQIRHLLQSKQALILLDDRKLTHDELEELLNAVPGCTFFLASPERRLWGEGQAVVLHGLPLIDALTLVERELGRSLTSQERTAAQSLCTILQGHPQHLLHTIGKVREDGCSLEDVVRQVRSTSPTQSPIYQILASLQEQQQRILAVLAALGGIALLAQDAAALAGLSDAESILESLRRRNLVQIDGLRYRLSETLVKSLQQQWDLTPWIEQALSYFTTWAQQYEKLPTYLLEETDAILHVLEWAVGAGRWAEVLQLVKAVEGSLALGKRWGLWAKVLQWGLYAARSLSDLAAQAWVLHQLGSRALCLDDVSTARDLLTQALQIRESLGDEVGAAVTRHNLNLLLSPLSPQHEPQSAASETAPHPGVLLWFKSLLGFMLLALAGLLFWPNPKNPTLLPDPIPSPKATDGTQPIPITKDVIPRTENPLLIGNDDTQSTQVDTPITIDVLANDSAPDRAQLSLSVETQPENGSVEVNADATVTYTPNSSFSGTDRFQYKLSDSKGETTTATVTIQVESQKPAENQTPLANDDTVTTKAETPVTIPVLDNDSDPDGDSLTLTLETQPQNGSVVVNENDTVTYQPNVGFFGTDRFTYKITDSQGGTDTATVTLRVQAKPLPPNRQPVANPDRAITEYETSVSIDVLNNDSDPDGDKLAIANFTQPRNGSVEFNTDADATTGVTYTPNAEFSGRDRFTYTIGDSRGGTATTTVTVTVNKRPNQPPVAVDDAATMDRATRDRALRDKNQESRMVIPVLSNDSDPDGDKLAIANVTQPSTSPGVSEVEVNPDGTLTYIARDTSGTQTFTYTVSDGEGGEAKATVTVTVPGFSNPDPIQSTLQQKTYQ